MSRLKEQRAHDAFKSHNHGRLLMKRVENTAGDPLSDIIGQNKKGHAFWLEMKALDEWPKRATTLPLKNAFEPGQIPFAKEWVYWGGAAYILLRVGSDEWYLLWPKPANDHKELVELTTDELKLDAIATGVHNIYEYLEDI